MKNRNFTPYIPRYEIIENAVQPIKYWLYEASYSKKPYFNRLY